MKRLALFFIILFNWYASSVCEAGAYSANVRAHLISDMSHIAGGDTFWIGLKMTMDDGWHTYWQNPGDSGMATDIQWDLPDGFEAGDLHWPYPQRIDYYDEMTSYIHDGEIILLTEMAAPQSLNEGDHYQFNAKVRWLSCEKICVPGSADLSISFKTQVGKKQINENIHQLFVQSRTKWPTLKSAWSIAAIDKSDQFLLNITSSELAPGSISELAFYPTRNDIIDHAGKQVLTKVGKGYTLSIPKSSLSEEDITDIQGLLVSPSQWLENKEKRSLLIDISVRKINK